MQHARGGARHRGKTCSLPTTRLHGPYPSPAFERPLPRSERSTAFVLSAFVENRFHANSLSLMLFSLQRFHPNSKVLIVDKHSPIAITNQTLPRPASTGSQLAAWLRDDIRTLRTPHEPINKREFSAYAAGLAFIDGARGAWSLDRFEQFVFAQAAIVLAGPIPSVPALDLPSCELRPLEAFGSTFGPSELRHGHWKRKAATYLADVGMNNSREHLGPSVAHNSFVATQKAVRQMLSQGRNGSSSVFDHPHAVAKELGELLVGIIINRINSNVFPRSSLGKRRRVSCSATLPWRARGRESQRSINDNQPPVGYFKLHGSGLAWGLPADVVLASLVRLADVDQDGLVSSPELREAILTRPVAFLEVWRAACTAFPIGITSSDVSRVHTMFSALVSSFSDLHRARIRPAAIGPESHKFGEITKSGAWSLGRSQCDAFSSRAWADHAAWLLTHLPKTRIGPTVNGRYNGNRNPANVGDLAQPFRTPMLLGTVPASEMLWGPIAQDASSGQPWKAGSCADGCAGGSHDDAFNRFANAFSFALFREVDLDLDRLVSFAELKHASERASFVDRVLVPSCLLLPQLESRIPNPVERPAATPRSMDLNITLARLRRSRDWNQSNPNGMVAQCAAHAAFFYAGVAAHCLACLSSRATRASMQAPDDAQEAPPVLTATPGRHFTALSRYRHPDGVPKGSNRAIV